MASVTIDNIPEEVLAKVRAAAEAQNHSVDEELVRWLSEMAQIRSSSIAEKPVDWDSFWSKVDARRTALPLTDASERMRRDRWQRAGLPYPYET